MADSSSCPRKKKIAEFAADPADLAFGAHLSSCEKCLSCYLSLIEKRAAATVPPGFAGNVMQRIWDFEKQQRKDKKLALLRYAVAASVAVTLWYNGVFQLVAEYGERGAARLNGYMTIEIGERRQNDLSGGVFRPQDGEAGIFKFINEKLFGGYNNE